MSLPVHSGGNRATKAGDTNRRMELGSFEDMVKNGLLVTPQSFQTLKGWKSRQSMWRAVRTGRVFYISQLGEHYFPSFYCDAVYDKKQLAAVTKMLGELPGGSKLQFFLTRKLSLDGATPLQALRAGRFSKVLDVAAAFAEIPRGST